MADNLAHPYDRRRVLAIDDLPDDDLLAIFDFCVVRYQYLYFRGPSSYEMERRIESWQSLVHVCRRWRGLVFGSPRRLNLQLYYDFEKYARKTLDVWPALPLLISGELYESTADNIIAALEHRDRVRQIDLDLDFDTTTLQIENLRTAMEVPFPELAVLRLSCIYHDGPLPVLPDSFLGGSAPRLRYFYLSGIPFPGLLKLLSSATHLVQLYLLNIPHSGYISPEAMATCFSSLTSLETLKLEFQSSQSSYPDLKSRRPFPPTRSVLPTLTIFSFKGVNEYLEEVVARIDAPQLYRLSTMFFNDIDFNTPELNQFINRTLTLRAYDEAFLIFNFDDVLVRLRQSHSEPSDHRMVEVRILGEESDRLLSTVAKICTLRLLFTMENLYIDVDLYSAQIWRDEIENTEWLDLLLSFTAVKNLYVSKELSPRIALVLQELGSGGRTTEVLPALQNVLLEGFQPSEPVQEGIARFISARQLINHPVSISVWHRDFKRDFPPFD